MTDQSSDQLSRLRFAPSPNGELHLGHAYSALKTWELAERWGGEVLLRIEDIDTGRTRETFVEGIYEDLTWLGLLWPKPVRRQSAHFDDYRAAATELRERGLLYTCAATRRQIADAVALRPDWPADPDGAPLYPGLARGHVQQPTEVAFRIDMERALKSMTGQPPLTVKVCNEDGVTSEWEVDPSVWGDAVIVRKDTPTSYHLSVVVDDALQGITHITRGKDLKAATSLHVLLQRLLALPTPIYHHHTLITDSAGRKLSKSLRDTSLRHLRRMRWTPKDVRQAVGITTR